MLKGKPAIAASAGHFALVIFFVLFSISSFAAAENENIHESTSSNQKTERKHQSGFFYGAMLGYKTEIYKGVENDFIAFPVVGYRSDRFNFLGPLVSYRLLEKESVEVSSILRYNFAGYDSSDSQSLDGMQDREASLDIGLGLSYKKHHWSAKLEAFHDVLGRSNGFELKSSLGKTYYFGPIFIEPNLGLSYWDNQYVDYYFGVEENEALAGRNACQGRYALNKNIGLNISTPIFFGGFTRLSLEHSWYDDSIEKSPITESDKSFGFRLTFSRFF